MQVLVVCTANIARSPLAAAMLERELGPDVSIASAGTRAREGSPATPESVRLGQERGLDLGDHRSRPVTPALASSADLVITMSERQRNMVSQLAPRMAGRVFTLREFARLTGAVDAASCPGGAVSDRLRWWRDQAHLARPRAVPPSGTEDVDDPIGRPWESWQIFGTLLDDLIPPLGARVRGDAHPTLAAGVGG